MNAKTVMALFRSPRPPLPLLVFDSSTWVENNLKSLTDSLVYIDSIGDELSLTSKYLEDSLSIINDSIDKGGLLETEQLSIIPI